MTSLSSKIGRAANYVMPCSRGLGRKCSMDGTVPIKQKSSICLKKIITTFFCSVRSCFCCDRGYYCDDSSEAWTETLFAPNTNGFLSCFFGPTMPCFFQTALSPFYSSEDLTWRASTFQRLSLQEGMVGFGQRASLWSQECLTVGAETLPEAGGLCSCPHLCDWELWRINIHNWCETMRQDGKGSFSLLRETLQKLLLQHMVTM